MHKFPLLGIKALDFTHREKLDHKCKKDILLGRMKNAEKKAWLKIRPRPTKDFSGPYMLCKGEEVTIHFGHCNNSIATVIPLS